MANVQDLQVKVQKAEEKVAKCAGTIEKHKKALGKKIQAVIKAVGVDLTGKNKDEIQELQYAHRATENSWTICEVSIKLDDIKGAEKKLREAEIVLSNWNEKLETEIEKERFIEGNAPQVIKDFMEQWKQKAFDWHIKRYEAYQEFKVKLESEWKQAVIEFVTANPEQFDRYLENGKIADYWMRDILNIRGKGLEAHLKELGLDYRSKEIRKADFAGGAVLEMDRMYREEERVAWLEKRLEAEKKFKLIDLVTRIHKFTGTITDSSYLKISVKGNIDGYVIGEKGKAKVETISAGGYNIQCFHFRTLVHKMK